MCSKHYRERVMIIVISAPSGSGKTTLCRRLTNEDRNIVRSVSMTTRGPRSGEREGKDYFFVTTRQFKRLAARDGFLEWAENFGDLYGTPRRFVEDSRKKKKDVILSIDVQGAMHIKMAEPDAVFIFIIPPSLKELKKRLHARNTEPGPTIKRRLEVAKKELAYVPRYDYVVVNDSIDKAFEKLKAIIIAERCRVKIKNQKYKKFLHF